MISINIQNAEMRYTYTENESIEHKPNKYYLNTPPIIKKFDLVVQFSTQQFLSSTMYNMSCYQNYDRWNDFDNIESIVKNICDSNNYAFLNVKNQNNYIVQLAKLKLEVFTNTNIPFTNMVTESTILVNNLDIEIDNLIKTNKTIAAIKLYRSKTGLGLRESKDAVYARKTILL